MESSDDVKNILINGKKVSYLDIGQGQPLVLIHSWPTCCKIFLQAIPHLNQHFRVIAPDLPGFGMSDELDAPHNYETISLWLSQFLKELHVNKIYLLGVSYGGAVALEFTKQYPEKVSLLLLNSPELYYYNQLNWFRKIFYTIVDKFPSLKLLLFNYLINESDWVFQIVWGHRLQNDEFVNSIKGYGKHLKYRATDETLHDFIYTDNRDILTTIETQTFIFTGVKERPPYLLGVSTLSKKNPHIYYECIEGVGHSVVVENPDIFASTILTFTQH
jgi:pimeloyl-ACP methyl ester carboxylesterase